MDVKDSRPVSVSDAKDRLEARKKDNELDYEQAQALEHAEKFAKETSDRNGTLVKELMKGGSIPEEAAIKLADIRPSKPETVKAILLRSRVEIPDEEIGQFIKILSKK